MASPALRIRWLRCPGEQHVSTPMLLVQKVSEAKLDFCKSRCLHDDTCTGYMVKGSGTELISAGQPCIFFSSLGLSHTSRP